MGLEGFVIVPPAPLTIVHKPVPEPGVFAESVTDEVQLPVTSGPAFAIVGVCLSEIITSSVEGVHGLLDIVHLKV